MSKTFNLGETSIPNQYCIDLRDQYGLNWQPTKVEDFYRALFTSIAATLKVNQSKSAKRVGFTFKDDKGNFMLGAILGYNKGEDESEDDTGNWYLQMTFDEEDMKDLDVSMDNHNDIFICKAEHFAQKICFGRFKNTEMIYIMIYVAIESIKKFLDINCTEDSDGVDLTLRGIFTASAAIEDGKKVMSIVPGEIIKQFIKDDSAL